MTVHDAGPGGAVELERCGAEQVHVVARVLPPRRHPARDVVDRAEHRDHRRRVDRHVAGLVVEADVAARHRDAEFEAAVGQALDSLRELPHHLGVLGRPEVQAVAHRDRGRAGHRDVAVRLGERELRSPVRVEVAVPPVRIGRHRETEPAGLVDPHHPAVVRIAQRGVAEHVLVVLVRDPALVGQVRRAHQRQHLIAQVDPALRAGEPGCGVGLQLVLVCRVGERTLVHGSVDGDGARVDVDDRLAAPGDDEPAGVGDLAQHAGLDVPLLRDREEPVELAGLHDRHHALLALRHQDLLGRERGVAQQHRVELDGHPALAVRGELARRARDARGPEILDPLDQVAREQLEAALDEYLLGERVADLHGRALGRATVLEPLAGQDAGAADSVAPGACAEQHDLVADTAGVGEVQVLVAQHPDRERVDQRVRLVHRVEPGLAADVRQAEAVAVEADAADHARQHAGGVGVVDGAEAEGVHDGDRAGAHRDDVAHDAADTGGRALERLHVPRVVVALDLERDRPALADIHHPGVLAHADHEVLRHLGADLLPELPQPDLALL